MGQRSPSDTPIVAGHEGQPLPLKQATLPDSGHGCKHLVSDLPEQNGAFFITTPQMFSSSSQFPVFTKQYNIFPHSAQSTAPQRSLNGSSSGKFGKSGDSFGGPFKVGVEAEGIALHIGGIPMNPCWLCIGDAETYTEVEGGLPGFSTGLTVGDELEDDVLDGRRLTENVDVVGRLGEQDPDVLGVNMFVIVENAVTDGVIVPVLFLLLFVEGVGELLLEFQLALPKLTDAVGLCEAVFIGNKTDSVGGNVKDEDGRTETGTLVVLL